MFSFFRTLRGHLLLLVFISVLPALGIIVYSGLDRRSRDIEHAKSDVLGTVKSLAYEHELAVENTRHFLMVLAQTPDVKNLNLPASNRLLGRLLKQNPLYGNVFIVNAEGFLCSSALPFTPQSLKYRKYFQDILRTKDFSAGEYALGVNINRPVLHFAYPIMDTAGKLKGAVAVAFDIARYARLFSMDKLPKDSTLSLTDHKGILLYRYPGKEINSPQTDLPDMTAHMSNQKEEGVFIYAGIDDVKRINAYKRFRLRPDEQPYLYVRAGIPEEKVLLYSRKYLLVNTLLLGFAFIIAIISAWFLGNFMIAKRLNKLVEASRRLACGDLKARTGLDDKNDELGELGKAFDEMAAVLEAQHDDHRRSEEALNNERQRFQMLAENAPFGMVLIDNDGNYTYVNPKFKEIFGYDLQREGMVSKGISQSGLQTCCYFRMDQ